jgi:epoxyqueuosine reductase
MESPDLTALMGLSPERWREFSRGSAIKRAKRSGFLRNVAVALGNSGSPEPIQMLTESLSDEEPLVREHAAWALAKLQLAGSG